MVPVHQPFGGLGDTSFTLGNPCGGAAEWSRNGSCSPGGFLTVRDPELVSCAQRAASELERAWTQWRYTRGLTEQVSESVASYVAHSIDHPWGRPRVVLGLDADEARALAALLGGDEGV
jgi:hypothetical protein